MGQGDQPESSMQKEEFHAAELISGTECKLQRLNVPCIQMATVSQKCSAHHQCTSEFKRPNVLLCDAQWAVTKDTCHAWKMNQPNSKGGIAWNHHFNRRETKAGKFGCKPVWNHAFSFIAFGGNSHFHPAGSL
jgi:hypothetical protein